MSNILKYQNPNSPLFNPHKIIENVPAREWGPRKINEDGTITEGNGTKFSRAPFQYWGNKGLGSQNEKLARDLVSEFDQMRSENPDYNYILDKNYQPYDDAINYLNHLEGLKKYLQLPYDTGLLMESEYKPTRLQGTNEKTYKFKSSTVPGYWDDVVDDMVIGEHDKNQYYDQSLNEFTAYRDRDEKGDFVSIYDEWDYNPAVRGGNKKLNKVVDSVTGGKPFVIYDRIYLDDHYDVPEEAKGNPFITPAVVTANAKHENGGVLKAQQGTPYGLPGGAPSYMQVQPFSPVGIALNQARAMAKMKVEQQHLPPGVKEVVGPDGKKVAIRTEQPLVPLEQSVAEWLPGTGDVAEAAQVVNDVKKGNYGTAALAAGLMFLPGNWSKLSKHKNRIDSSATPISIISGGKPAAYERVGTNTTLKTTPSLYAQRIINGGGKRTNISEDFAEIIQNVEPKTFVTKDPVTGRRSSSQQAMYWREQTPEEKWLFGDKYPNNEITFYDDNVTLGETTFKPINVFTGESLDFPQFIPDPNKKLSLEQMSILRDHEGSHLIDRRTGRAMDKVDFINGNGYIESPTELHARITQAKDAVGITDGSKTFTGEEYKKMFEKYLSKGNPDNQMSNLYYNVKDWDKLAKWANTFVPGIGAVVLLNGYKNERE